LYALRPDPRTLLILQTAALAVTAWPVWRLAKGRLTKKSGAAQIWPLVLAAAWLLNPSVQNANLFEFHLLPFALPFLFLMLVAYNDRRPGRFALWAAAAMLFREDVSLVVAAVGLLAFVERRGWRWVAGPIALGASWFVLATRITAHYAPAGAYKFLAYYAWLGEAQSFGGVLANAAAHPLRVIRHVASFGNVEMLLGFLLPLLLLPAFALGPLVLALGPLLQILLGAPGGSSMVTGTHYATLFLPGLFLAATDGLPRLSRRLKGLLSARKPETLAALLLLFASAYGSLALGPLPSVAARLWSGEGRADAADARCIVSQVPPDAPVAASYRLLPHLSSRARVYSAHYIFLGTEQFGTADYPVPDDVQFLAFDENDLPTYRAQFLATGWTRPHYPDGRGRLALPFGPLRKSAGRFALYGWIWSSYMEGPKFDGLPPSDEPAVEFADGTRLTAMRCRTELDEDGRPRLLAQTVWQLGPEPDSLWIDLSLTDSDGRPTWRESVPLVGELWQSSAPDSTYVREIDRPLPSLSTDDFRVELELVARTELHTLDGLRSTERMTIDELELGRTETCLIENDGSRRHSPRPFED
ncbi:MAG: DUF2079 domain-containing protein, partial [bacterium]